VLCKSIIDLIEYLTSQRNISVYLLPQVIGPGQDNDRIINKEVYSKLKNIDHVNLIDIDISPQELKDLYSKLDLLIGTRMHSNIFALSSGTPCVAISYEQKTDGIMSDLNLSNYVIKIDKINSTELIEKVNLALADHANIKHHLAINIPKMLDRSAENNRLLFEYLREKGKK
ncbi:polysaccharide pyruvyl transferase family protein, partial [Sporolactobacillus vineae]|uniref:polysaccharide pyruvyl transferase family protein n=1 Tax=Sporolactobacillus vineae TaxID=444463 RepID=UPI000289F983